MTQREAALSAKERLRRLYPILMACRDSLADALDDSLADGSLRDDDVWTYYTQLRMTVDALIWMLR